jgi:acetyl-CoA acetyltransferase
MPRATRTRSSASRARSNRCSPRRQVAGDLTGTAMLPARRRRAAATLLVSGRSAEAPRALPAQRCRAGAAPQFANSETLTKPADSQGADRTGARSFAGRAGSRPASAPRNSTSLELHDAFSVEELLYTEAVGVCAPGEGAAYLERGDSLTLAGAAPSMPSGGLIGMGHPLGPTGVGQIAEITRQIRGEAEGRQHPERAHGPWPT